MANDSRTLPPEERVDWKGTDRLEVLRRIGEGGMGVVYEVADRETGRRLAVKTLINVSPTALYRFKQEFRILADVRHRNLVRLHELVVTDSSRPFFTMELVPGTDFVRFVRPVGARSISDRPTEVDVSVCRERASQPPERDPESWRRSEPFITTDLDKLRLALRQLVEGLHALHGAGKVHRDVKPSNVLITPEGRVVILDFGVATQLARARSRSDLEQEVVGTTRYMAPEQAACEEVTPASDLYSVGVMLYESLVGRPPFVGSGAAVLALKSATLPVAPSERVRGIPSDLEALCMELLDPDPALRPNFSEILRRLGGVRGSRQSAPPSRSAPTLIGREAQLRALREAFEASLRESSVTVRVGGASGMGKSAVVRHFVDSLVERSEGVVLRGRAYERESVPYKAVDGIVDALSRHLMRLDDIGNPVRVPPDIGSLARIFPVLRRVRSVADVTEGPASDPRRLRQRAFAALRELLRVMASRAPLVLYVDDAQWGDADSAALLLELVQPPNAPPVLIVMTYRDNEAQTSPFLREIKARWPDRAELRDIAVGPLEREDSQRLARALLGPGNDAMVERTADAIAREGGGSPFLIEELARGASGDLLGTPSDSAPTLAAVTLEQMVGERLRALPAGARRFLEIVAVSARRLPVGLARDAASIDQTVDDVVSLLSARRFVNIGMHDGYDVVETIHDRIRETIAAQLSPEAVRVHHQRLARVLEATPDADPEALALHLRSAGESDRAARYAERAADRAATQLAFDQAARLLRLALETTPASSADGRRLRQRLGEVLEWAGLGAEAARVYLEAAESASTLRRAELERAAAHQLLTCGRIDEGAAVLRRVLATAGLRAPRSPLSAIFWLVVYRVWAALVGFRYKQRDADDVSRLDRLRLDALYSAAMGFGLVNVLLGACIQTRYFVMALRVGDRPHVMRAALILATQCANIGGPETPRERSLRRIAESIADQTDGNEDRAFVHGTRGVGLFLRGRWKEALEVLDAAYARYPNNRAGWQSNANLFAVYTLLFLGDLRELAARRPRLLREAEQRGDLYTTVNLKLSPSKMLALAADDPETALRESREALSQWSQRGYLLQHWHAMRTEADAHLYAGDSERAYARVVQDMKALRKSFLLKGQFTRALSADLRGRVALASAGSSSARRRRARLREARCMAHQLERERMPYATVLALMIRAGVASGTGDRAGAMGALRDVIPLAEQAHMTLYVWVARYHLGNLLDGVAGRQLARRAHHELEALGVRVPSRFAAVVAPGMDGSDRAG
jgi:serine/threonine protein kinase